MKFESGRFITASSKDMSQTCRSNAGPMAAVRCASQHRIKRCTCTEWGESLPASVSCASIAAPRHVMQFHYCSNASMHSESRNSGTVSPKYMAALSKPPSVVESSSAAVGMNT